MAEALSTTKQAVGHWKTRGIPAKKMRQAAEFVGKSLEWLEFGPGESVASSAGQAGSLQPLENIPTPQIAERRAVYRVVSLEAAVEGLARHFESVDGYDKATAISLLSTLANSPDMHAVVAAGLKTLKPLARGSPSKQGSPAQTANDPRAA